MQNVIIKQGILSRAGEEIKKVWPGQNYVIISDENVWPLYGANLEKSLAEAGFTGMKIIIKPGEAAKSLDNFKAICESLADSTVGRDWLMIALGGGVVGDLAGFVASVYKRGMEIVQIPSSLLAQVDSSLGGKSGVNLDQGKNLIGAFNKPLLVLTDTGLLQTLNNKHMAEGMAEIIKYGAILDRGLFEKLESMEAPASLAAPTGSATSVRLVDIPALEDLVIVAAHGKLAVTEKDEKDRGDRRKLNFGHSFGHAIEKMTGYRDYSHGEAVAMGMCLASKVGEALGLTAKSTAERIEKVLDKFGLPTDLPIGIKNNLSELLRVMGADKKNEGGKLRIILLKETGKSFVHTMESSDLLQVLKKLYPAGKLAEKPASEKKIPEAKLMKIDKIPYGTVKLPPSKSCMHRATIMAALAGGLDLLTNTEPHSHDTLATLTCMKTLTGYKQGIDGEAQPGPNPIILDVKESGATLRFILPLVLALAEGESYEIKTAGRLLERPQDVYFEVLRGAGASIRQEGTSLFVSGELRPGEFILPGDLSSQYVSGLLMALPLLKSDSRIKITGPLESAPYVDMTLSLMNHFGVHVDPEQTENNKGNRGGDGNGSGRGSEIGKQYLIKAGQKYKAKAYEVEGDYSAAAYFLVAGALGCQVECGGLKTDSLQGDKKILEFLEETGALVEVKDNGNIQVSPASLTGITADVSQCPDLAPPLAVLFSFCKGESRITGAGRLAMKESNRLESIAKALNALGGSVKIEESGLLIQGQESIKGGRANPSADHRIAMAIALASVKSPGEVYLENPDCVSKSYPEFFKDFCRIERRTEKNGKTG